MNQPQRIRFSEDGSKMIDYVYTSGGGRLRRIIHKKEGDIVSDYVGNMIYEDGKLKYIFTDGGRVLVDKSKNTFDKIKDNLALYVYIKYQKEPVKLNIENLEDAWISIKDVEIKEFGIRHEINLARAFESRKKIVEEIEKMLLNYYEGVVQNLKEWVKPAPKVIEKKDDKKDLDSIE